MITHEDELWSRLCEEPIRDDSAELELSHTLRGSHDTPAAGAEVHILFSEVEVHMCDKKVPTVTSPQRSGLTFDLQAAVFGLFHCLQEFQ